MKQPFQLLVNCLKPQSELYNSYEKTSFTVSSIDSQNNDSSNPPPLYKGGG